MHLAGETLLCLGLSDIGPSKEEGKNKSQKRKQKVMRKSQDPDFRGMIMQEVAQKKSHNKLIPD